jgi:hypothetical protein
MRGLPGHRYTCSARGLGPELAVAIILWAAAENLSENDSNLSHNDMSAVGLHAGWDWSQSYLYGVPDSGQVASGHLFATHPSGGLIWSGGPTGPEGSIYMIPTMAVVALGVWIAWSQREPRKEPDEWRY